MTTTNNSMSTTAAGPQTIRLESSGGVYSSQIGEDNGARLGGISRKVIRPSHPLVHLSHQNHVHRLQGCRYLDGLFDSGVTASRFRWRRRCRSNRSMLTVSPRRSMLIAYSQRSRLVVKALRIPSKVKIGQGSLYSFC